MVTWKTPLGQKNGVVWKNSLRTVSAEREVQVKSVCHDSKYLYMSATISSKFCNIKTSTQLSKFLRIDTSKSPCSLIWAQVNILKYAYKYLRTTDLVTGEDKQFVVCFCCHSQFGIGLPLSWDMDAYFLFFFFGFKYFYSPFL